MTERVLDEVGECRHDESGGGAVMVGNVEPGGIGGSSSSLYRSERGGSFAWADAWSRLVKVLMRARVRAASVRSDVEALVRRRDCRLPGFPGVFASRMTRPSRAA